MTTKNPIGGDATILFARLYHWLRKAPWRDQRHLITITWMLVGLMLSRSIHPAQWCSFRRYGSQTSAKHGTAVHPCPLSHDDFKNSGLSSCSETSFFAVG